MNRRALFLAIAAVPAAAVGLSPAPKMYSTKMGLLRWVAANADRFSPSEDGAWEEFLEAAFQGGWMIPDSLGAKVNRHYVWGESEDERSRAVSSILGDLLGAKVRPGQR